jgi:hypothetical protein
MLAEAAPEVFQVIVEEPPVARFGGLASKALITGSLGAKRVQPGISATAKIRRR